MSGHRSMATASRDRSAAVARSDLHTLICYSPELPNLLLLMGFNHPCQSVAAAGEDTSVDGITQFLRGRRPRAW